MRTGSVVRGRRFRHVVERTCTTCRPGISTNKTSTVFEFPHSKIMIPTKILVVGATGQQGGGVVNALLSLGSTDLTITASTRNPTSAAAQKLSSKGVGLCKGDLLDRESLVAALADVDAAYLVTDFRGPEGVSGELQQGRQFVDCAREAGL